MTSRGLWCRIAFVTVAAIVLALTLSPPEPSARIAPALAVAVGAAAGSTLFAAASRRLPRVPWVRRPAIVGVAKQTVLGLCAANEEVIWRRVILGELLPVGTFAALAVSSAGFALAHRRSRTLHLATGSAFGLLYIATGTLAACIAAHWTYNAFVGALAERGPP